jgi:hypothetical protein
VKQHALPQFWQRYRLLPDPLRRLADKNFELLKTNPHHPSLHLKKVGEDLWSVRVGKDFRALARSRADGLHWFWIGSHAEYEKLLSS